MSSDKQLPREELARAFVEKAGWSDADIQPLPGDASSRRYIRLVRGAGSAMLMDQPRGAETSSGFGSDQLVPTRERNGTSGRAAQRRAW